MRNVIASGCMLLTVLALVAGCITNDDNDDPDVEPTPEPLPGQITRPAASNIALDDPGALEAFEVSEDFLVAWLFLRQPDQALREVSSDRRPTLMPVLEDTQVSGTCRLTQVAGDVPDENGVTTARYRVEACQIVPVGTDDAATQISVTVTLAEQRAWVVALSFEHPAPAG